MLVQWLTFAIMILIQTCVAVWAVSAIRTALDAQGAEIKALREWRHEFGPKAMVIDDHTEKLGDHESRLRALEHRPGLSADCVLENCPFKRVVKAD